jgi:uncharacterized cupin superfamily protein
MLEGWFVVNSRDAQWVRREGRGYSMPFEQQTEFPQVGIELYVLGPGEPIGMYHWEANQEDFLVLSGEGLLLIEGEERHLRQWDFVHCPPRTNHIIIGAGERPCVVLGVGARDGSVEVWGGYPVDELAQLHGVGVEEATSDAGKAYARFPSAEPAPYGEGRLPSL